jgi:hypothetical protein
MQINEWNGDRMQACIEALRDFRNGRKLVYHFAWVSVDWGTLIEAQAQVDMSDVHMVRTAMRLSPT